MRRIISLIFIILFSISIFSGCCKIDGNRNGKEKPADKKDTVKYVSITDESEVMPDTWVFTDALGRTSLTYKDVGVPREGKDAAMFFWTWHIPERVINESFCNIQKYLDEHPEITEYQNYNGWPEAKYYFWNEPIYGYYLSSDEWVARRQGELLANAGIDVVFTDNTNGSFTWESGYTNLFNTWLKAQKDGVNTPKISFMFPFVKDENTVNQLTEISDKIFKNDKYKSLFYYLDDKPMVIGQSKSFNKTDPAQKEITDLLTFRRNYSAYFDHPKRKNNWGWLSIYPQGVSYRSDDDMAAGIAEETTVGVSANYSYTHKGLSAMNGFDVTGRSYTSKGYHTEDGASKFGYNFAEQFDYALEIDPKVIFITGWNEFIANKHDKWPEGYSTEINNAFPDEFNDEYSRDIEPTKGALADNYYYQLVNYVRRYKGVREIPKVSLPKTIDIKGDVSQWKDVEPYYAAYKGNTGYRDSYGYGNMEYTEYSGRNDIVGAKVARDDKYIYFIAECASEISPYTDNLWMTLYIDSEEGDGWNTFDYVINKTKPSKDKAHLEAFTGIGYESYEIDKVEYSVYGRYIQITVPKSKIGINGDEFTVNFTWTDNVHDEADSAKPDETDYKYSKFSGDIMDFYISGDVAPGGRFKYCYDTTVKEK